MTEWRRKADMEGKTNDFSEHSSRHFLLPSSVSFRFVCHWCCRTMRLNNVMKFSQSHHPVLLSFHHRCHRRSTSSSSSSLPTVMILCFFFFFFFHFFHFFTPFRMCVRVASNSVWNKFFLDLLIPAIATQVEIAP